MPECFSSKISDTETCLSYFSISEIYFYGDLLRWIYYVYSLQIKLLANIVLRAEATDMKYAFPTHEDTTVQEKAPIRQMNEAWSIESKPWPLKTALQWASI